MRTRPGTHIKRALIWGLILWLPALVLAGCLGVGSACPVSAWTWKHWLCFPVYAVLVVPHFMAVKLSAPLFRSIPPMRITPGAGVILNIALAFGQFLYCSFLAFLAFRFLEWRRVRKPRPGCRTCGHNLIDNESGICPECGRQHVVWSVRIDRMSTAVSLVASIVTGLLLLVTFPFVLEWYCMQLWDTNYIADLRFPETATLTIFLAVWLVLSYVGARALYMHLRWGGIEHSVPHCGACGYNLTGNESGICPECDLPRSPDGSRE